jgi:hypothetical protein
LGAAIVQRVEKKQGKQKENQRKQDQPETKPAINRLKPEGTKPEIEQRMQRTAE